MVLNLFDPQFYRSANQSVANLNDTDAFAHFQSTGIDQGLRFSSLVDLDYYRASYGDLGNFNPRQLYDHLTTFGVKEGRKFSPFVDLDYYAGQNPDLGVFNNDRELLFNHLKTFGVAEARKFSPFVDIKFYQRSNDSYIASLSNKEAFDSLALGGIYQGYNFSPVVDLKVYQLANPGLPVFSFDNYTLFKDLVSNGVQAGRRFSSVYDTNFYRSRNGDLAGLNNVQLLEHFKAIGINQGRASSESFDVSYYLGNNQDLVTAGLNNQQALEHYIVYGFKENRMSSPGASIFASPNRDDGTIPNAFDFGLLNINGNRDFDGQSIGGSNTDDYYRFTLSETGNLNLSLLGLQQGTFAKVELIADLNGNGKVDENEVLNSSTATSDNVGLINQVLGTGNYFIKVSAGEGIPTTNYGLKISSTKFGSTTQREAGDNFGSAFNAGALTSGVKVNYTDFVGTTDRSDIYNFSLSDLSTLNVSLTGTVADYFADVELIYDTNGNGQYDTGEQLYSGSSSAFPRGMINQLLAPGNYSVRVSTPNESLNTKYDLELSATSVSASMSDPGSSASQALDIGNFTGKNGIYQDFVGTGDREDWYRFNVVDNRNLSIYLGGLSDSVSLEVIFDRNANGLSDVGEAIYNATGNQFSEVFGSTSLEAGNYWTRVYANEAVDNSRYTLAIAT
jgi:hypothetical protein